MGLMVKCPSRPMSLQSASLWLMEEGREAARLLSSEFKTGSIYQLVIGVTLLTAKGINLGQFSIDMTLMEASNSFSAEKMTPFIVWSD